MRRQMTKLMTGWKRVYSPTWNLLQQTLFSNFAGFRRKQVMFDISCESITSRGFSWKQWCMMCLLIFFFMCCLMINLCKQVEPKSGSIEHCSWSGSKLIDTYHNKILKNYPACKELDSWDFGTFGVCKQERLVRASLHRICPCSCFCSCLNWEGAVILLQIKPRKIPEGVHFSSNNVFVSYEGDPNTTKRGHYRPASEKSFRWCFAGGPMMAQQHWTLALKLWDFPGDPDQYC